MKKLASLVLLSFFVGCSDDPQDPILSSDTGTTQNDAGAEDACVAETDEAMCARLEYVCGTLSGDDNCGKARVVDVCGTTACPEFTTCGGAGVLGACGCSPETDAELCTAAVAECGPLNAVDRCGEARVVASCGDEATVCEAAETCGGAGELGVCGCLETDAEMCARVGYICGELVGVDKCGVARTVGSCGDEAVVCAEFGTCGGAGVAGECGCTPKTDVQLCAENNYLCGILETVDNCGTARTVRCTPDCICGDNVCGSPSETPFNCPADCPT